MKTYLVTGRAGPYVAGVRVAGIEPGSDGARRVSLSDAAALYELQIGSIAVEAYEMTDRSAPRRKKPEPAPEAEPAQ